MKRTFINLVICALAVVSVASCSKDDDMSYEERKNLVIQQMITTGMQPSDAGISLRANAVDASEKGTRAIINSTKDGYFETGIDQIGIMMLAQKVIMEAVDGSTEFPEYKPYNYLKVDWSSPKAGALVAPGSTEKYDFSDTWSVYLANQKAKATYVTEDNQSTNKKDTIATRLELALEPTNSKNYYPLGGYHNYYFYGYAPYQDNSKVKYTKDSVYVRFDDLNGSQDVIRGYAEPVSDQYVDPYCDIAYCAKYFRYKENRHEITLPDGTKSTEANPVTMKFEHKMMQLQFRIKAGGVSINNDEDIDKDYREAYKTRVDRITVTNVPQVMELLIARRNKTGDNKSFFYPVKSKKLPNGQFEVDRSKVYEVRNLARYDKDGKNPLYKDGKVYPQPTDPNSTAPGSYQNIPAVTPVGDGILLPVLDDLHEQPYMINIRLEYPEKVFHELLVPMRLPVSGNETYKHFEPGKIYNVTLTIYNPEQIRGNATLTPWEIAPDDETPFIFVEDNTFPIH